MNEIVVKMEHPFLNKIRFTDTIRYDDCLVTIDNKSEYTYIVINGREKIEVLEEIFWDINSILFLCIGCNPKITELQENNISVDVLTLTGKFRTWDYFLKKTLPLCEIKLGMINQNIIKKYRQLHHVPIESMRYLISEGYKDLNQIHRLTLLLHVLDGVIPDSAIKTIESEIRSKYKITSKDIMGGYLKKTYCLCKTCFFNYDFQYSCGILNLLNLTEFNFLQAVTDTRNWYSHFFNENKKVNRVKTGDTSLYYFEIIYLVLRMYLLGEIGMVPEQELIKEAFYNLHDWIAENKNTGHISYKSQTYQNIEKLKELRMFIGQAELQNF